MVSKTKKKTSVCGKFCLEGNVYKVFVRSSRDPDYLYLRDDRFYNPDGYSYVGIESVSRVEGINGETLEDAPFIPNLGQWCAFSHYDSFKPSHVNVAQFGSMKGKKFMNKHGDEFSFCKPISSGLADMLDREL